MSISNKEAVVAMGDKDRFDGPIQQPRWTRDQIKAEFSGKSVNEWVEQTPPTPAWEHVSPDIIHWVLGNKVFGWVRRTHDGRYVAYYPQMPNGIFKCPPHFKSADDAKYRVEVDRGNRLMYLLYGKEGDNNE